MHAFTYTYTFCYVQIFETFLQPFGLIFWLYLILSSNCQTASIGFIIRSILLQFFILYRAITRSIKMFCFFYLFQVRKQLCDLLPNGVRVTFHYYQMYASLTLKQSILFNLIEHIPFPKGVYRFLESDSSYIVHHKWRCTGYSARIDDNRLTKK